MHNLLGCWCWCWCFTQIIPGKIVGATIQSQNIYSQEQKNNDVSYFNNTSGPRMSNHHIPSTLVQELSELKELILVQNVSRKVKSFSEDVTNFSWETAENLVNKLSVVISMLDAVPVDVVCGTGASRSTQVNDTIQLPKKDTSKEEEADPKAEDNLISKNNTYQNGVESNVHGDDSAEEVEYNEQLTFPPHAHICTMNDLFSKAWMHARLQQLQTLRGQQNVIQSYILPSETLLKKTKWTTRKQDKSWHVPDVNRRLLECKVLDLSVDGYRSLSQVESIMGMVEQNSQFDLDANHLFSSHRNFAADMNFDMKRHGLDSVSNNYEKDNNVELFSYQDAIFAPLKRIFLHDNKHHGRNTTQSIQSELLPPLPFEKRKRFSHHGNLLLGGDGLTLLVQRLVKLYERQFGGSAKILPTQHTSRDQPFYQTLLLDGQALGDYGMNILLPLFAKGLILESVSLRYNDIHEAGGLTIAATVEAHRQTKSRGWFGLGDFTIDLAKNAVCNNVLIDPRMPQEHSGISYTFSAFKNSQCDSAHGMNIKDLVYYFEEKKSSAMQLFNTFNAAARQNNDNAAIDNTELQRSYHVCTKVDIDTRNSFARKSGLVLANDHKNSSLVKCDVLSLNPRSPQLGEEPIGDSGLITLANSLFRCHRLRRLDLSYNNISATGLTYLLKVLKHTKLLEALILDGNPGIGDAGAILLGRLLQRRHSHRHLRLLALRNCGITAIGALDLTQRFNNPNLRRIELGWNFLGTTGALILADIIREQSSFAKLKYLGLEANNIAEEGAHALCIAASTRDIFFTNVKRSPSVEPSFVVDLGHNNIRNISSPECHCSFFTSDDATYGNLKRCIFNLRGNPY